MRSIHTTKTPTLTLHSWTLFIPFIPQNSADQLYCFIQEMGGNMPLSYKFLDSLTKFRPTITSQSCFICRYLTKFESLVSSRPQQEMGWSVFPSLHTLLAHSLLRHCCTLQTIWGICCHLPELIYTPSLLSFLSMILIHYLTRFGIKVLFMWWSNEKERVLGG